MFWLITLTLADHARVAVLVIIISVSRSLTAKAHGLGGAARQSSL